MSIEPRCPGPPTCTQHTDSDTPDLDHYCDTANIQPGEEPIAFAAWLNAIAGWDGEMTQTHSPHHDRE